MVLNTRKIFLNDILKTIDTFHMLEKGDNVLIAVSGGPDSTALTLSLAALKNNFCITIGIAHINHLLRGAASENDEAFTKAFAEKLDIPFYVKRVDVKAYASAHRLSIEEAGRKVRYDFLYHISNRFQYSKIATGHTKNDNAEQVLMNVLRGSGPKGLSGIPPVRENLYIRPLIHMTRDQILAFLDDEKQQFVIDSSNEDMTYLRNRIRHALLPELQSEYNPEIVDSLDRLSRILRLENDHLEIEAGHKFNHCLLTSGSTSISFSISKLAALPIPLFYRVMRKAILKVKTNLKRISYGHMNDIFNFCFDSSSGTSIDLPDQIRIYKTGDSILVKKEAQPLRIIGKKEKQLRQMAKKKQEKER